MKIVLLDRDGTIIQDPLDERVDSLDKIELFPDTIAALRYLAEHEFGIVIITNQAGIAEGRITEAEFWSIHDEVLARLAPSGATFIKTYMNPEASGPDASEWHKPGPKMLLAASQELNFNISSVYMIGDNQSDIDAGIRAGCKGSVLVKTARNKVVNSPNAEFSAPTLLDAVRYAVEHY